MANSIYYNNLGTPIGGSDEVRDGISFTTGSSASFLTDVMLEVRAPDEGMPDTLPGVLTISLDADSSTSPGELIAILGTIDNASLPSSVGASTDVPVTAEIPLGEDTRYWITLSDTSPYSIQSFIAQTAAGIGVSGEFVDDAGTIRTSGAGGPSIMEVTASDIPPCYCRGTRIMTDHGEIAIEDLVIGDRLLTNAGAARPIRWIGRRGYDGRFAAGNVEVLPVLIRAGALADGVPRRDLYVSPQHAMHIDGVLIPAGALVNGASILQMDTTDAVEYFHVELDTHDVILAEGAPAETFVDDGNRGTFQNSADYQALHPDASPGPALYCAPRLEDGDDLEAVRARLAERAPPPAAATRASGLRGNVDAVSHERIRGWARDLDAPERPVELRILDNGAAIAHVVADEYRPDLDRAGFGEGRHSFALDVPGGLSPTIRHVIQVSRVEDGRELPGSPWTLEAIPVAVAPTTASLDDRRGRVDQVCRERAAGWAWNSANPNTPVALQILDNDVVIGRVVANHHRPDLTRAGLGLGRNGFEFAIPGGLSPFSRHVVAIRRESDGLDLPGSPVVIEPSNSFDGALERTVASAVDALVDSGDQERVMSFMLAQAERLAQQHADAEAARTGRLAAGGVRRRLGTPADSGLRALVVDERAPAADRDAGSVAILSHMRALRRLGYDVSFVAAREMAASANAIAELTDAGIAHCGAPFYGSVEDVMRRQAGCFDLVYLHRAEIASRYLALARAYSPEARIVYSVADLHHVRMRRQAEIENRPQLLTESGRMRRTEIIAATTADAVITHSADEAAILRGMVPHAEVFVAPWDMPARPAPAPFLNRNGLALIAHYAHAPNEDAAHWLVEAVMPLVWQVDPDIACLLVGSDMPDRVRRLAGVRVTAVGQVADLDQDVFDRVRLTAAPLRYGAGVKGKVLQSMAAGIPCVMSEIAAEGINLGLELRALVCRDAPSLAASICRMHADEASNASAAEAGLALIRQDFSEERIDAALRAAISGRAAREAAPVARAG